MSDEEKKEFEHLKEKIKMNKLYGIDIYLNKEQVKIIENLIKEIEEAEQKERKAYIKGTNDADELCNKKWKDKIKAKIEEIDEKLEYETNGWESEYEYCKAVLQSLLEKE